VLALSVVLMHHLVAAHQHVDPGVGAPAGPPAMMAHVVAPADVDVYPLPDEHAGEGLALGSPAAMLHVHHGSGGDDASMFLHACPAVLAALAALLLLLVAVWWRTGSIPRLVAHAAGVQRPVRGPPAPRRLAELQVLRL
jgi:hypothetical protein